MPCSSLLPKSMIGNWTLRLQDISPTGQFAYCLVISPTGHFAYWSFGLQDISHTGQFAYWTVRLLPGHFAYRLPIMPTKLPE